MLRPDQVARAALLMASLDPNAALEELTLLPAGRHPLSTGGLPGKGLTSAILSRSLIPRACGETQGGTNAHVD